MEISLGFYSHNEKNKSPRAWFGRFAQVKISLGYRQSQGDHTLFIKHSLDGKLTLFLVYVDDMIVTSDDEIEKLTLKEKLTTQFEMKELGKLKYFLEIEVAYSIQGIFISQRKYELDLLKETEKLGCKISGYLLNRTVWLGVKEILVGKFIYLSHTKLDISFAVSMVSQFMHDSQKKAHSVSLKDPPVYEGKSRKMTVVEKRMYMQAMQDQRSTSGYCMFLGENLVTCKSKKQNVIARSSPKVEFRAMAHGVCEGLWMKIILDLKVKHERSTKLFCDNNSTIRISNTTGQNTEIDRNFIKEKLDSGFIVTTHVFTKGLPTARFQELNGKLDMIDIHLST
ncbi:putative mitochondrial protein, partial [Mucuna pruriens]